ncbi:hypothetical protein GCM10027162_19140 [Streptomyces incanus]
MHDERHRIEHRAERLHHQRVKPAVHAATVPLTVEAWHAPGDASGDVVVRLYESRGGRAAGTLRTGFPLGAAMVTDLLERPLEPADTDGDAVPVALRPFQVLTLRLGPVRRIMPET